MKFGLDVKNTFPFAFGFIIVFFHVYDDIPVVDPMLRNEFLSFLIFACYYYRDLCSQIQQIIDRVSSISSQLLLYFL